MEEIPNYFDNIEDIEDYPLDDVYCQNEFQVLYNRVFFPSTNQNKELLKEKENQIEQEDIFMPEEEEEFYQNPLEIQEEFIEEKDENNYNPTYMINNEPQNQKELIDLHAKSLPNNIQSKFRISTDFSLFHQEGDVEYDNRLRNEINEDNLSSSNNKNNFFTDSLNLNVENKNIKIKSKENKKRKNVSDYIRKKIKSRFFNTTKNRLNDFLEIENLEIFFYFLSQSFITNVTKDYNKKYLFMTLKELMNKNLFEEDEKSDYNDGGGNNLLQIKRMDIDRKKYEKNKSVNNYLNSNVENTKNLYFNFYENNIVNKSYKEYIKYEEFGKLDDEND